MTAKTPLAALLSLFVAATLGAQSAQRATPVHTSPEVTAPVILLVKPGEDLPATAISTTAPAGWTAVTLPGPHEVFVNNHDIGKDLDLKADASLRTDPKSDAAVLTQYAPGDEIEITGLRGRWTQLRLKRDVVAYIHGGASAPAVQRTTPVVTSTPVSDLSTTPVAQSPAPAPRPTIGRQVARSENERNSLAALPRLFEGKLASTRVPLRPRRPYDFALEADDGTRFAYLDLTKLLLTEQIEKYLDRTVVVYGVARPVPDTKDIVIAVESLQLR